MDHWVHHLEFKTLGCPLGDLEIHPPGHLQPPLLWGKPKREGSRDIPEPTSSSKSSVETQEDPGTMLPLSICRGTCLELGLLRFS